MFRLEGLRSFLLKVSPEQSPAHAHGRQDKGGFPTPAGCNMDSPGRKPGVVRRKRGGPRWAEPDSDGHGHFFFGPAGARKLLRFYPGLPPGAIRVPPLWGR